MRYHAERPCAVSGREVSRSHAEHSSASYKPARARRPPSASARRSAAGSENTAPADGMAAQARGHKTVVELGVAFPQVEPGAHGLPEPRVRKYVLVGAAAVRRAGAGGAVRRVRGAADELGGCEHSSGGEHGTHLLRTAGNTAGQRSVPQPLLPGQRSVPGSKGCCVSAAEAARGLNERS